MNNYFSICFLVCVRIFVKFDASRSIVLLSCLKSFQTKCFSNKNFSHLVTFQLRNKIFEILIYALNRNIYLKQRFNFTNFLFCLAFTFKLFLKNTTKQQIKLIINIKISVVQTREKNERTETQTRSEKKNELIRAQTRDF